MTDTFTWGCEKWADCGCCRASQAKCNCGASCGCGTVTIDDVKQAMDTQCEKSDCKCGMTCRCGKGNCNCGGSTLKTQDEWIQFTKGLKTDTAPACNCEKDADGNCMCGPSCSCAGCPASSS